MAWQELRRDTLLQARILILIILIVFLWLTSSSSLTLAKIRHFAKVSRPTEDFVSKERGASAFAESFVAPGGVEQSPSLQASARHGARKRESDFYSSGLQEFLYFFVIRFIIKVINGFGQVYVLKIAQLFTKELFVEIGRKYLGRPRNKIFQS